MQDPQHTDENVDAAEADRGGEPTDSHTREPTDADPLLPEVEQ